MKRIWKVVGIATLVAILGVATIGAVALAQNTQTGSTGPFDLAARFREAIAGALGISLDDYDAAVDKAQQQVIDEAVTDGWLTQDQAEMLQWRMDQQAGAGLGFGGPGLGGFGRGLGGPGDNLLSIAADKLDMSLTDLLTELQGGKTIADLAKDKGVDTQIIVDAAVAQMKTTLQQSVDNGQITQKQADWQLEQATTRITDQLDNTWNQGLPGGGPRGRMMGMPGLGG
jgi:hypothetical protein